MLLDMAFSHRLPNKEEIEKAQAATQALAQLADKHGALSLPLRRNAHRPAVIDLPPAISALVLDLLRFIGRGEAVTLVPYGAELTTQQAADLLNVSRPFLIKLINERKIKCHRVGSHRRIKAEELFAYRDRRDKERGDALDELANLGQEIDAG